MNDHDVVLGLSDVINVPDDSNIRLFTFIKRISLKDEGFYQN